MSAALTKKSDTEYVSRDPFGDPLWLANISLTDGDWIMKLDVAFPGAETTYNLAVGYATKEIMEQRWKVDVKATLRYLSSRFALAADRA